MKKNPSAIYGKLIACDPVMGLPRVPPELYKPDPADLLSEMGRIGVDQALVRHRAAYEAGPVAGNQVVMEECAGHSELRPTWCVTPDGLWPDFDVGRTVNRMVAAGVRACWMDAAAEEFSYLPWCSGRLYGVLQERRIPLLIEYAKIRMDDLAAVLADYRQLRLVLIGPPRMGRNRLLYPLLERHANLRLCLNYAYSVHRGFEDLCARFGHERWVFGLGYPEAEAGASLCGLTYADISDQARTAIAYGNIERLLAEAQ